MHALLLAIQVMHGICLKHRARCCCAVCGNAWPNFDLHCDYVLAWPMQQSKCTKADISPCPPLEEDADTWLKYPVDFPHVLDGAERDHSDTLSDAGVNATAHAQEAIHEATHSA